MSPRHTTSTAGSGLACREACRNVGSEGQNHVSSDLISPEGINMKTAFSSYIPTSSPPLDDPCPEVPAQVRPSRRGDVWLLRFCCPWCSTGRRLHFHEHGGGPTSEAPFLGHRQTHCLSPTSPQGYILVASTGSTHDDGQ